MEARTERQSRTRKVGTKGTGSLHAVEKDHILIEVWNPAVDYGRFKVPTDESLTTDGHPMAAPTHSSAHPGGGFAQTDNGRRHTDTRGLRSDAALRYTGAIPLEDHITES